MALGYGNLNAGVYDGTVLPAKKADGIRVGAKVRTYREIFDLASATVARNVGDTNLICRRPKASAFRAGSIIVTATLGSSTLAIGSAAVPAKYAAAATYTVVDTPTGFGKGAARAEDPLADYEDVFFTVGAANLPNAGLIIVDYETLAR